MTLPTPPAYNQLFAKTSALSDDCGETCVAAALTALGHDTTVDQTVAVKAGLNICLRPGQSPACVQHYGCHLRRGHRHLSPTGAARGHYCIVGITSGVSGNLSRRLAYWSLAALLRHRPVPEPLRRQAGRVH